MTDGRVVGSITPQQYDCLDEEKQGLVIGAVRMATALLEFAEEESGLPYDHLAAMQYRSHESGFTNGMPTKPLFEALMAWEQADAEYNGEEEQQEVPNK